MANTSIRARKKLRLWRETHNVTQDQCGAIIKKSGDLIRLFELTTFDLTDDDCMKLSRRTGIPFTEFLTATRRRRILDAHRLLEAQGAV